MHPLIGVRGAEREAERGAEREGPRERGRERGAFVREADVKRMAKVESKNGRGGFCKRSFLKEKVCERKCSAERS